MRWAAILRFISLALSDKYEHSISGKFLDADPYIEIQNPESGSPPKYCHLVLGPHPTLYKILSKSVNNFRRYFVNKK